MTKYHISPETGEPKPCKEKVGCPYGKVEDHYPTKEDARKAFEAEMSQEAGGSFKTFKKEDYLKPSDQITAAYRSASSKLYAPQSITREEALDRIAFERLGKESSGE